MKLLLVLVSLTIGTAGVITTVDWMNRATAVMDQVADLTR